MLDTHVTGENRFQEFVGHLYCKLALALLDKVVLEMHADTFVKIDFVNIGFL